MFTLTDEELACFQERVDTGHDRIAGSGIGMEV